MMMQPRRTEEGGEVAAGAGGSERRGGGGGMATEETSGKSGSFLRRFRSSTLILFPLYVLMVVIGFSVLVLLGGRRHQETCHPQLRIGIGIVTGSCGLRLLWMVGIGVAQAQAAETLLKNLKGSAVDGRGREEDVSASDRKANCTRQQRRIMYKRWLAWSQGSVAVSGIQVVSSVLLAYCLAVVVANGELKVGGCCPPERGESGLAWLRVLLLVLTLMSGVLSLLQCCIGADVLAWRSLYAMHDFAWRAHYQEMFDRTIREVLCCLGRSRYWENDEDDDVKTVASLLGELVAYRAFGASHLELLAGLAMLTRRTWLNDPPTEDLERPATWKLREAAVLHPYAVAAYTGPLLDIGRNPLTWACVWLYRQGLLSCCWGRKGWPLLEGDNYWRGHSAAFLRFSRLPPSCLLKGRVKQQANNESVYFVVALANVRMVVVSVRGTETPEDLITDGLGRECILTESDLGGALRQLRSLGLGGSACHFGHEGVVKAARELAYQLDGLRSACSSSQTGDVEERDVEEQGTFIGDNVGFLSSILGPGGRCEGYQLRFVGHSLGGAVATVTAMILQPRFPDLHVYAFGVLPCLDLATAEACRDFVTSIVYNDEFSCRLSLASIMRLRTAALRAVAPDPSSSLVTIPAYLLGVPTWVNKKLKSVNEEGVPVVVATSAEMVSNSHTAADEESGALPMEIVSSMGRQRRRRRIYQVKGKHVWSTEDALNCQEMEGLCRGGEDSDGGVTATRDAEAVELSLGGTSSPIAPRGTGSETACSEENSAASFGTLPGGPSQLKGEVGGGLPLNQAASEEAGNTYAASTSKGDTNVKNVNSHNRDYLAEESDGHDGIDMSRPLPEVSRWGIEKDAGLSCQEWREVGQAQRGGEGWSYRHGVLVSANIGAAEVGCGNETVWPVELFLPGQVVHLLRRSGTGQWPPSRPKHKAVVVDRRRLAEVRVSPSMFLDHLPWRCQNGLNDVLEELDYEPPGRITADTV